MTKDFDKISSELGKLNESAKQQNESIKLLAEKADKTHNLAYATKMNTDFMARELEQTKTQVKKEHGKIFERIEIMEKRQRKNSTFVDLSLWCLLAFAGIVGAWITGIGNIFIDRFMP